MSNGTDGPSGPIADAPIDQSPIGQDAAIAFLIETACYFERRNTHGEDMAHWANVYNADNCRRIARLLATTPPTQPAPKGPAPE